ncbi:MAG: hypothetical protein WAT70_05885 [Rhizobiaceae bacterium]
MRHFIRATAILLLGMGLSACSLSEMACKMAGGVWYDSTDSCGMPSL